jgi:hypothetical protein
MAMTAIPANARPAPKMSHRLSGIPSITRSHKEAIAIYMPPIVSNFVIEPSGSLGFFACRNLSVNYFDGCGKSVLELVVLVVLLVLLVAPVFVMGTPEFDKIGVKGWNTQSL